jgi:CP family cyanate transporter-like MFS transporter
VADGPARAGEKALESRLELALLGASILLLALNLRPAITGLPPIFPELRGQLGLSSGLLAFLAAVPLLCFALASPLAARLSGHFGEARVLAGALAGLAIALLLRAAFPSILLFPATVAAATAITALNVLVPSLVKRRHPRFAGVLLGEYLFALYIGGTVGSLVAVPLYRSSGHSLLVTLGIWTVLALLGFICWLPQMRGRREPAVSVLGDSPRASSMYHSALGWQISLYFGLQSMGYYASISWLPSFYRARGASATHAGFLASMLGIGGLITALVVPIVAQRLSDQRILGIPIVFVGVAGLLGALFAPLSSQVLWTALLGLGQGASLGLATYLFVARARSPVGAASLSAMSQTVGYVFAAAGPLAVGLLHSATGAWKLSLGLLFPVLGLQLIVGWLAGRPAVIGG